MTLLDHANRHAECALILETWAATLAKDNPTARRDHIRWLQLQASQCRMAEAAARMEAVRCAS